MCQKRRTNRRVSHLIALAATLVALAPSAQAQQARGSGGLPPRDEWQRVPEILAALRVTEGQRVADIAAGQGYLTKPLARKVGKSGRVYAVEISEESRRALANLAGTRTAGGVRRLSAAVRAGLARSRSARRCRSPLRSSSRSSRG